MALHQHYLSGGLDMCCVWCDSGHMTTPGATGTYFGKCSRCGRAHFAETADGRGFCDCRAGVACELTPWGAPKCGKEVCDGHPQTSIKWRAVVARTTSTRCDATCEYAQSDKCSCACGGRNHARGHALDLAGAL